jgi:predicted HAD superfamily Cof-like phosphohydrolase
MSDHTDVKAFHEKFQVPVRIEPQALETTESEFRVKFMREELEEYELAVETGDLEKQFDALLDLVYVAYGTALMHGFPWAEGWSRVQAANMAKISAKDAGITGRHPLDVVKPVGWTPPDLSDLVRVTR